MEITAFVLTLRNASGEGPLALVATETSAPEAWTQPPPERLAAEATLAASLGAAPGADQGRDSWQANYRSAGRAYGFSLSLSALGVSFSPQNSRLLEPTAGGGTYRAIVVFEPPAQAEGPNPPSPAG